MLSIMGKSSVLLHTKLSVRFASRVAAGSNVSCKLLVVGTSTGGLAVAHRFANRLKKHELVVLDNTKYHYFKDEWCLVGAGFKSIEDTRKLTSEVLPENALWVQASPKSFNPGNMEVTTSEGATIKCEYMVVAPDREPRYDVIKGLKQALADPQSGVCSIYGPDNAVKTWKTLRSLQNGNALFFKVFVLDMISAAENMVFLADSHLRTVGGRSQSNVTFFDHWEVICDAEKYNNVVVDHFKKKDITVHYKKKLNHINSDEKVVTISGVHYPYDFLHVLFSGYVPEVYYTVNNANKKTFQNKTYPRIYLIGPILNLQYENVFCTGLQSKVVEENLLSTMENKPVTAHNNGYSLIPYITSRDKCVLAEWKGTDKYHFKPYETLPWNQATQNLQVNYYINRYVLNYAYWNCIIKGKFDGSDWLRSYFK